MSRYRGYRRSYGKYSKGQRVAIEHVREYNELVRRLGPIVEDVNLAFFNLNARDLDSLFEQYRSAYGSSAYRYARETFKKWKGGDVRMSGQTAKRLLDLVPPFLRIDQRFDMVEKLCAHYAPKESRSVSIQLENTAPGFEQLKKFVAELAEVPAMKYLPDHVLETVTWLHDNDVVAARALLSEIDARKNRLSLRHAQDEVNRVVLLVRDSEDIHASQEINLAGGTVFISIIRPRKSLWHQFKKFIS